MTDLVGFFRATIPESSRDLLNSLPDHTEIPVTVNYGALTFRLTFKLPFIEKLPEPNTVPIEYSRVSFDKSILPLLRAKFTEAEWKMFSEEFNYHD